MSREGNRVDVGKGSSSDDSLRVVFGQLDSEPVVITELALRSETEVSYDNIRDHRTPQAFKQI
jgi:hypothetical protein